MARARYSFQWEDRLARTELRQVIPVVKIYIFQLIFAIGVAICPTSRNTCPCRSRHPRPALRPRLGGRGAGGGRGCPQKTSPEIPGTRSHSCHSKIDSIWQRHPAVPKRLEHCPYILLNPPLQAYLRHPRSGAPAASRLSASMVSSASPRRGGSQLDPGPRGRPHDPRGHAPVPQRDLRG